VYQPTTRVLTVLELLQARGQISGSELAERLEIDRRTVRRYITMLQDLGIPVEAERGRYGGYRLRPGFKLPPLMFTEDEALAIVLGMLTARRIGLTGAAPAVEGALAKVDRVLPAALRERIQAVQETLVLNLRTNEVPPMSATVIALSSAARQRKRVRMRYRSFRDDYTERMIDPYGVVYHGGNWYAAAHCHLRHDARMFRLDRVLTADICDETFVRPDGFDSLDFVLRSLAATPRALPVCVTLRTSLEQARERVPASLATLEDTAAGVRMRCSTDNPAWFALVLASLECELVVHEPSELRDALRDLGERLVRAGMGDPSASSGQAG
jgi:predicted DNA-binding transcriptional regulator YafY